MSRGEITSTMLVTIILLIAGFTVLLLVFFQIGFETNIDDIVCHESVILRGTSLELSKDIATVTPLKCKTSNVCVSDKFLGKGECENKFTSGFETVRIDKNKIDNQIKMTLGREMIDCWDMMGRGKLQIFAREILAFDKVQCVICSRVSFDDSVKNITNEVSGMSDYLIRFSPPGNEKTYMQILTNSDIENEVQIQRNKNEEVTQKDFLNLEEDKAIVFVQATKGRLGGLIGGVVGGGAGVLVGAKVGGVIGSFVGPVGTGVGFAVGGVITAIYVYVGAGSGGEIQSYITGAEGDYGSGVILADYTDSGIQGLDCDTLENIP